MWPTLLLGKASRHPPHPPPASPPMPPCPPPHIQLTPPACPHLCAWIAHAAEERASALKNLGMVASRMRGVAADPGQARAGPQQSMTHRHWRWILACQQLTCRESAPPVTMLCISIGAFFPEPRSPLPAPPPAGLLPGLRCPGLLCLRCGRGCSHQGPRLAAQCRDEADAACQRSVCQLWCHGWDA